jgi:hypothetical protein
MKKNPLIQIIFTLLLLVVSFTNLTASENPITGMVADAETKEPLPYANILVGGKHKGTVSNSEGYFILEMDDISLNDTVVFLYMGYETLKIKVTELQKLKTVYLRPSIVNLQALQVVHSSLSEEEIIKRTYKNFKKNQASTPVKQSMFVHNYAKTPFQKENKLNLKEVNFVGLDKKTFNELLKKMPAEFIVYQDAIIDLYSSEDKYKLIPVKGISMEEGSQQALMKEFENKLSGFFEDIDKSMGEKDIYYKIRTGILSQKIGNKNKEKEEWNNNKNNGNDSLNFTIETEQTRNYLLGLLKSYTDVDSKNWEFINSTNRYHYTLEEVSLFNDEEIYKISFIPKKKGVFEGTVYISAVSFAILQLDFAFAKGKKTETFKLFGISHATNFREAHIIFEKGQTGYYVKYMNAQQKEYSSINRDFSLMKKQKRLFIDKELNEIKLEAELFFNTTSYWELMVLEREEITSQQFEKVKEPEIMKFKKEYVYTPEMWENRTVIVPASELKKYKRK